jgi:hypothetical protein
MCTTAELLVKYRAINTAQKLIGNDHNGQVGRSTTSTSMVNRAGTPVFTQTSGQTPAP